VYSLGFTPLDTQEISYDFCRGQLPDEKPLEQKEEILGEGSATGLFPRCTVPPPKFINDFYFVKKKNCHVFTP